MKLREYLWLLEGWTQLTSMPRESWGLAVALSFQGDVLRLMQQIPVRACQEANGLATVVYLLEQMYGTEDQDLQQNALEQWEQFS